MNIDHLKHALDNDRTVLLFCEMMCKSGHELEDGTPLTMELVESWPAVLRHNFLVVYLIQFWDHLSPEQQAKNAAGMPPECYLCGVARESMSPCAGAGYTRLECIDCARKTLLHDPEAGVLFEELGGEEELRTGKHVQLMGLKGRADLNHRTGKVLPQDGEAGRWGVRMDGSGECVRVRPQNICHFGTKKTGF